MDLFTTVSRPGVRIPSSSRAPDTFPMFGSWPIKKHLAGEHDQKTHGRRGPISERVSRIHEKRDKLSTFSGLPKENIPNLWHALYDHPVLVDNDGTNAQEIPPGWQDDFGGEHTCHWNAISAQNKYPKMELWVGWAQHNPEDTFWFAHTWLVSPELPGNRGPVIHETNGAPYNSYYGVKMTPELTREMVGSMVSFPREVGDGDKGDRRERQFDAVKENILGSIKKIRPKGLGINRLRYGPS